MTWHACSAPSPPDDSPVAVVVSKRFVRGGDEVVVHSMDRLARNLDDLRRLVQELTGRGVRVGFVRASRPSGDRDAASSHGILLCLLAGRMLLRGCAVHGALWNS